MWREDTETVGVLRTSGLSHSLAVVLWGGHLIVAGTEEGGVLHQVPAEKPEEGSRWDCSKTWLLTTVHLNLFLMAGKNTVRHVTGGLTGEWRDQTVKRRKGSDLRLVGGETFIWNKSFLRNILRNFEKQSRLLLHLLLLVWLLHHQLWLVILIDPAILTLGQYFFSLKIKWSSQTLLVFCWTDHILGWGQKQGDLREQSWHLAGGNQISPLWHHKALTCQCFLGNSSSATKGNSNLEEEFANFTLLGHNNFWTDSLWWQLQPFLLFSLWHLSSLLSADNFNTTSVYTLSVLTPSTSLRSQTALAQETFLHSVAWCKVFWEVVFVDVVQLLKTHLCSCGILCKWCRILGGQLSPVWAFFRLGQAEHWKSVFMDSIQNGRNLRTRQLSIKKNLIVTIPQSKPRKQCEYHIDRDNFWCWAGNKNS